ncbi:hypothetical protein MRY82_08170 [bacterium]|nr:hypothetical protein [bacterium]
MIAKQENIKAKALFHPVVNEFAQAVGDFIAYWGFSETDGKIWSYIYIQEEPVETPDIIEFVKKSKASVSISITKLLNYGLIEKKSLGRAGTVRYVAAQDVSKVIFSVLRQRELKLLSHAKESMELLQATKANCKTMPNLSQQKLDELQDMIELSHKILKLILSMDKQTIHGLNTMLRGYINLKQSKLVKS